jgi:hypothetical protein
MFGYSNRELHLLHGHDVDHKIEVMGAFIVDLQEQEAWHSLILHYIKIWHP